MANELSGIAEWMYDRLSGSIIIQGFAGKHPKRDIWNIYEGVAVQGASNKRIVFAQISSRYVNGASGSKVIALCTYQVLAYVDGNSFEPLRAVADEIEAVLHQETDLTQPTVVGCMATRPVQGNDEVEGVRKNFLGSEFRVFAYTRV